MFFFSSVFQGSQSMVQLTRSSRVYKLLDAHFSLTLTPLKPACFLTRSLSCHDYFAGRFSPRFVEHEIVMHLNIALSPFELWYSTVPKAFWGLQSIFKFTRSSGVHEAFCSVQGPWGLQVISQGKELRGVRVLPGAFTASSPSLRTAPGSSIPSLSVRMGHTP